ncbi:MAG: hypothetical protein ACRD9Q_07650 [Nitrososphaeraceae archaeon]
MDSKKFTAIELHLTDVKAMLNYYFSFAANSTSKRTKKELLVMVNFLDLILLEPEMVDMG